MNVALIRAKQGKEGELGLALQSLVAPSQAEPGCVQYVLHRSSNDSALWMMYEVWTSQDALNTHFTMPHMTGISEQLDKLLDGPMELLPFMLVEAETVPVLQ